MNDDRSDCTVLSTAFPSLSIPTKGCCSGTVIMGIVCRTTSEPSTDPSFPSITRIRSIDFTGRSLSGPVPSVLADLRWLTSLRLNANAWTGNLPESFRTMTSLTDMSFFDSSLSGPLPSWLGELTEMQTLNMDHTQISGPIPDSIRRWSKLRKLWLGHNNLFGDISTIFTSSNHPNLELLDIAGNFISGRLDISLEQTSQIRFDDNCMVMSDALLARQARDGSLVTPRRTVGCDVQQSPIGPPLTPPTISSSGNLDPTQARTTHPNLSPFPSSTNTVRETINQSDVLSTITEEGRSLIISRGFNGSTTALFTLTSPPAATTTPLTRFGTAISTIKTQTPAIPLEPQQNLLGTVGLSLVVGFSTFAVMVVVMAFILIYWKRRKAKAGINEMPSAVTSDVHNPPYLPSQPPSWQEIDSEISAPPYSDSYHRNPPPITLTLPTSATSRAPNTHDHATSRSNVSAVDPVNKIDGMDLDLDASLLVSPKVLELERARLIVDIESETSEGCSEAEDTIKA